MKTKKATLRARLLLALLLLADVVQAKPTSPARIPSPDGRWTAIVDSECVTITGSRGHVIFSDDYRGRDFRPERGRWTRSGRFFVYSLFSRGGHSPWNRPFVIGDTQTRRAYTDSDLREGESVTGFELSDDDTISYQVMDRTKDNSGAGVPGISRRFSIAKKIAKRSAAK